MRVTCYTYIHLRVIVMMVLVVLHGINVIDTLDQVSNESL